MISPYTPPGVKVVNIGDWSKTKAVFPECTFPKLNEVYTVREIVMGISARGHDLGILLQEIINPISPTGQEWNFTLQAFRRLITPEDFNIITTSKELENV